MRPRLTDRIMARFEKTRLDVVSAVLILLGLYALAGLGYAAWMHSEESVVIWTAIAVVAFVGAFGYQTFAARKKGRTR